MSDIEKLMDSLATTYPWGSRKMIDDPVAEAAYEAELERESERLAGVLEKLAALGEAATPAAAAVLPYATRGYPLDEHALAALQGMLPELVVKEIRAALAGDDEQCKTAVKALEKLSEERAGNRTGPNALGLLLRAEILDDLLAIEQRLPDLRSDLARSIGAFGAPDKRAFASLVAMAKSDDNWARNWCAHGLVHFGDLAVPTLELLSRDRGEADRAAVYCLGCVGTKLALEALGRIAKSAKGIVGFEAKDTLGSIANRRKHEAAAEKASTKKTKAKAKKPAAKTKRPAAKKPAAKKPAAKKSKSKAKVSKRR